MAKAMESPHLTRVEDVIVGLHVPHIRVGMAHDRDILVGKLRLQPCRAI